MQLDGKFQFSHNYFSDLDDTQRMWRAVIVMAFKDAVFTDRLGGIPKRGTPRSARLSAREWIFHDQEDFHEVCRNAAIEDPERCRKALIKAIRHNDTLGPPDKE